MKADLSAILSGIVEATLHPEAWSEVCDAITERMDGTAFMIFEYDVVDGRGMDFHGSRQILNHKDLYDALLSGGGDADNEIYFALTRSQPGVFATEAELLGLGRDEDIPGNPYRDAVMARMGTKCRAGCRLNDIGPWVDVAALHLPVMGAALSDRVRSEMNLILPVIGKSLETGRIVRALSRRYGALLDFFDRLDFAVGFLGRDGRLVLSNECLNSMIRDGDGLSIDGNRLSSPLEEGRRRLNGMLRQPDRVSGAQRVTILPRRSGRRSLIAKTAPISGRNLDWNQPDLTMILVLDPEDEGRISSSGFDAFRLLTPAEIDVCDLLVRGFPTEEISEHRSTSIETTRNQVKSAASKLGCKTRIDLIRLALVTHAPVVEKSGVSGEPGTGPGNGPLSS